MRIQNIMDRVRGFVRNLLGITDLEERLETVETLAYLHLPAEPVTPTVYWTAGGEPYRLTKSPVKSRSRGRKSRKVRSDKGKPRPQSKGRAGRPRTKT